MYLEIMQDTDIAESPRDWDNVATMACSHQRYKLGDWMIRESAESPFMEIMCHEGLNDVADVIEEYADAYYELKVMYGMSHEDASTASMEKFMEVAQDLFDTYFFSKPLYLYDHSAITINTGGYSCPWDSGQVGVIYIKRADYPDMTDEQFDAIIESEVAVYRDYLEGNVWGFVLRDDKGNDVDSCWGFFGDWEDCGIQAHVNASEVTRIYNTTFQEEIDVKEFFECETNNEASA